VTSRSAKTKVMSKLFTEHDWSHHGAHGEKAIATNGCGGEGVTVPDHQPRVSMASCPRRRWFPTASVFPSQPALASKSARIETAKSGSFPARDSCGMRTPMGLCSSSRTWTAPVATITCAWPSFCVQSGRLQKSTALRCSTPELVETGRLPQ